MMILEPCIILLSFLFLIKNSLRLFFSDEQKLNSFKVVNFVLYFISSLLPILAFNFNRFFILIFYILYIISCFLQELFISVSKRYVERDIRIRFVIFGSIHLFCIGLISLFPQYKFTHVGKYPIVYSLILTVIIRIIMNIYIILDKKQFGILLATYQKNDLKYLFYFLNLGVIYIFEQSVIYEYNRIFYNNTSFFLLGNIISVIIISTYLHTLYRIKNMKCKEQSNFKLKQSIEQTNEQIKHLLTNIHFDQLTGARSRLFLIQETSRLFDFQIPFALVYIDLNGLKKINDEFGHKYGDKYLSDFVKIIYAQINKEDTVSRFGGDEFVLIFPKTNLNDAEKRVNDIQHNIHCISEKFKFAAGCAHSSEANDLNSLISIADERMYKQKETRRNINHVI